MADILLNTLKNDLDSNLTNLLDSDQKLASECKNYLQELLINDEFLSTETYTTNIPEKKGEETKSRNLIEEIAELDQSKRQVNLNLASLTKNNQDLIIGISSDLERIGKNFKRDYVKEVDSIVKSLDDARNIHASKFAIAINEKLKSGLDVHNNILTNMEQILDLLELPALCKLCILQGNYQEALEISVLVQALVIRFPNLSIFKVIHRQIESELKLMVKGLIKLLSTNLKQNHILKIFRILNQLDIIDNHPEFVSEKVYNKIAYENKFLMVVYLNSRFKFIVNEVSNLNPLINYNKLTYLKRLIEIYREHIFTSLSIYYAIFTPISRSKDYKGNGDLLISQFINSLTTLLVEKLSKYFPDINQSSNTEGMEEIDSQGQKDGLVLQILYLCKSLAKYNVDFESIITWDLCYKETPIIAEKDWLKNLSKIKKFKS